MTTRCRWSELVGGEKKLILDFFLLFSDETRQSWEENFLFFSYYLLFTTIAIYIKKLSFIKFESFILFFK